MAGKDKKRGKDEAEEAPVDLAARIGVRRAPQAVSPASPQPVPIDQPQRLDAPLPSRRPDSRAGQAIEDASLEVLEAAPIKNGAIPSPRLPPGPGEMDIVATPLPTLDDWHRFELALRKIRGVGHVTTEYFRHGVLKVRVSYDGQERLAQSLRAGVPGYRVRVIGEDRATIQILVSSEGEERRPG
jgi:hypothetical protein